MATTSLILDQLVHFRDLDLSGLGMPLGGIFVLTYAAFKYTEAKKSPVCQVPTFLLRSSCSSLFPEEAECDTHSRLFWSSHIVSYCDKISTCLMKCVLLSGCTSQIYTRTAHRR